MPDGTRDYPSGLLIREQRANERAVELAVLKAAKHKPHGPPRCARCHRTIYGSYPTDPGRLPSGTARVCARCKGGRGVAKCPECGRSMRADSKRCARCEHALRARGR